MALILFNNNLLIKCFVRTRKRNDIKATLHEFNFRPLIICLFKIFGVNQFTTCIKYLNSINCGIIIVVADVNSSVF